MSIDRLIEIADLALAISRRQVDRKRICKPQYRRFGSLTRQPLE